MRELKFRFWNTTDKRWIDSCYVNKYGVHDTWKNQYYPDVIAQQYTGLKDAQGTEIYEGDILKHDIGLGPIYWEVIWNSEAGQWQTTKENGGNTGSWFDLYLVAGNIFETPELLK
jgi:hypothetical protein